jgi:hypothetical protein
MKTRPTATVNLTTAQEIIQRVILVIVSLVIAWIVYRVRWHVYGDPCFFAVVATAVVVVFLWLTRWLGSRGVKFESTLFAAFLAGMPLVYVARYLFASTARTPTVWLWVEILGIPLFSTLAILGLKRSPWFLASGIVVHGLAWDSWHYRNSVYVPDWYAIFCLVVDLAFGAYVAARIPAYRKASRVATQV